jgi:hypothetical protein
VAGASEVKVAVVFEAVMPSAEPAATVIVSPARAASGNGCTATQFDNSKTTRKIEAGLTTQNEFFIIYIHINN